MADREPSARIPLPHWLTTGSRAFTRTTTTGIPTSTLPSSLNARFLSDNFESGTPGQRLGDYIPREAPPTPLTLQAAMMLMNMGQDRNIEQPQLPSNTYRQALDSETPTPSEPPRTHTSAHSQTPRTAPTVRSRFHTSRHTANTPRHLNFVQGVPDSDSSSDMPREKRNVSHKKAAVRRTEKSTQPMSDRTRFSMSHIHATPTLRDQTIRAVTPKSIKTKLSQKFS
jgi:hypothetical protein